MIQANAYHTPLYLFFAIMLYVMPASLKSKNWLDNELAEWWIVNDTVMGGRSVSELLVNQQQGFFRFQGQLSLENNGGFASTRSLINEGFFSNTENICIEVRGDGREYQFRLRSNQNFDGYAYVIPFKTLKNQWVTQRFSFADFTPRFRGRMIRGVRNITAAEIRQVGFLLGDKSPGTFQLDFRFIGSCA